MKQVTIENPIINSPFIEPVRHFKFDEDGITNEILEKRRVSSYFIPIAQSKKRGKQSQIGFNEWKKDREKSNEDINRIRHRVNIWRQGGYSSVSRITRRLLEYWQSEDREHRLFFCQIEAMETVIYLAEVARKFGDGWIANKLHQYNLEANPDLFRIAMKMATGSGKTVVMAMLIAWQALNKLNDRQSKLFSDAFLVISPGITIRDRLRVLLPNDSDNYYHKWDLVPPEMRNDLGRMKIIVTNYHAMILREKSKAGRITKTLLHKDKTQPSPFKETPDQMVRRVLRGFGNKKNILVINDEAHHCYRHKQKAEDEKLTGDDRKESKKREEAARIWISGLEAIKRKIGIRTVYDLSATPFFLRGSGYKEGDLFPWVVSDFSLIDAIESGIVKVPRVPVSDDSMTGDMPTYRELWLSIKDSLPKSGRGKNDYSGSEPKLPKELEGAIHSLYSNYKQYYQAWEEDNEARSKGQTPPVFIVICNNTNVSKIVYDYISGWSKKISDDESILVPGKLEIFSNARGNRWLERPNTILIDSTQLESGEAMSKEFKKTAAREIENFKEDYRRRFPGKSADKLTDEDLLREVMNTVGKPDKLGEHIKCVVSVSMLTEGWDANTVTHILGIRAFGTQLLCEQVVGRGLRRRSYVTEQRTIVVNGKSETIEAFSPEYAEVYGVPFSFIPVAGAGTKVVPPKPMTHVRAIEDRIECEITYPRVIGYRYELPPDRIEAKFSAESELTLSTEDIPTKTEIAPIAGEIVFHTQDELKKARQQQIAFNLTSLTLEKFRDDDANDKQWLFPQLLAICMRWLKECLILKDDVFPGILLFKEMTHHAVDRIYDAIVDASHGEKRLLPMLPQYEFTSSTKYVSFDTSKPVYKTDPQKCHISHVVGDTNTWEQKMAQSLEDMDEVRCYVKNTRSLNFLIPYNMGGKDRNYEPDFIVRIDDGNADLLNLIIEVSGQKKRDKEVKVMTARNQWIPAVNNHGGFGRWAFLEIKDPYVAKSAIRYKINKKLGGHRL